MVYVYKYLDKNEDIIYIGYTNNINRRYYEHLRDKKWICTESEKLYYTEIDGSILAKGYEAYLISKHFF